MGFWPHDLISVLTLISIVSAILVGIFKYVVERPMSELKDAINELSRNLRDFDKNLDEVKERLVIVETKVSSIEEER